MPCYQIITAQVEFKVKNVDLLETALNSLGLKVSNKNQNDFTFYVGYNKYTVDFKSSKLESSDVNQQKLDWMANEVKKAYSLEVINLIAKKNKWQKKELGKNRYALQRF